jgi:hypothetical protein
MHDIEIVLNDDSTIVIEETKSDFYSSDGVEEDSVALEIDYSGTSSNYNYEINGSYSNEMNFNSSSVQQAAAITKAPLVMAASRAKTGLNEGASKAKSGLNRSFAKFNGEELFVYFCLLLGSVVLNKAKITRECTLDIYCHRAASCKNPFATYSV